MFINPKFKVEDRVLYKTSPFSAQVFSGTIKKYIVECDDKTVKVCYFVQTSANKVDMVSENNILSKVNNTVNKEVVTGKDAEEMASKVLESLDLSVEIQKIIFDGNKTTLHYRKAGSYLCSYTMTSECHPDDKFDKSKGIYACICKISIKLLKEKLENI